MSHFNPRTPAKECDFEGDEETIHYIQISIHAPPRRSATKPGLSKFSLSKFQSTHPREGVRHREWTLEDRTKNFNPRTPAKECDFHQPSLLPFYRHFNPRTPAKECDTITCVPCPSILVFQSTHPREGVRLVSFVPILVVFGISIHAPPRRSATLVRPYVFDAKLFQSTHPREGVRPQHIANRELHLLHIGCQTAEQPTVSVIFE